MRFLSKATLMATVVASLIAGPILAAPVNLSSPHPIASGFGATVWDIDNNGGTTTGAPFTGDCDNPGGLNILDATSPGGDNDAFDNGWNIFINEALFNAGDVVDITGTTVTAGPVPMSNLNVTVEYYFSTTAGLGRIRPIFSNPTGSPITVRVEVPVNFGSDDATVYETTSSGDTVVTTADRWVISSEGSLGEYNTTVMYGPGAPAVTPSAYTTTVFNCYSTHGLGATFLVTVPAGATRSLVFFAGLGAITRTTDSLAGAISAAAAFDGPLAALPAEWLTGLDATALSEVLNWDPRFVPPVVGPIPTLSQCGLLLLGGLMALVGLAANRKRKAA